MTSAEAPCFVHIGAPKTGTTFLQRFLTENQKQLRARGYLYPDVSLRGFGHHDVAFLLAGGYPKWAKPQSRKLEELARDLAESAAGHVGPIVLSSEDFYLYPEPAKLRELLRDTGILKQHDPRIIVYLRRQDIAHESWYNQTVKAQGYSHSFEDCVATFRALWDYRLQLEAWESVFEKERIVVRVYEGHAFEGRGLLQDFLVQLRIDPAGLNVPEGSANFRLNRDALEFQRLINELPLAEEQKRRFHRELSELSHSTAGKGLFSEAPLLDPVRREALLAEYRESNSAVAAKYFGRASLFAAPTEGQLPEADHPYSGLTSAKLAQLLGWLLIRQGHRP